MSTNSGSTSGSTGSKPKGFTLPSLADLESRLEKELDSPSSNSAYFRKDPSTAGQQTSSAASATIGRSADGSAFTESPRSKQHDTVEVLRSTPTLQLSTESQQPTTSPNRGKGRVPQSRQAILVSPRQKGNPLLSCMRHVPHEFDDSLKCDYMVTQSGCVLFLSTRYHARYPNYIGERIDEVSKFDYRLRIVLLLVDLEEPNKIVEQLNRYVLVREWTLILAWSNEEAARYLEHLKASEYKSADIIKPKIDEDYLARATAVLTKIPKVTKTDVITLLSKFHSIRGIIQAPVEALVACEGIGEKKARRMYEIFRMPFGMVPSAPSKPKKSASAKRSSSSRSARPAPSTAGSYANFGAGNVRNFLQSSIGTSENRRGHQQREDKGKGPLLEKE